MPRARRLIPGFALLLACALLAACGGGGGSSGVDSTISVGAGEASGHEGVMRSEPDRTEEGKAATEDDDDPVGMDPESAPRQPARESGAGQEQEAEAGARSGDGQGPSGRGTLGRLAREIERGMERGDGRDLEDLADEALRKIGVEACPPALKSSGLCPGRR